MSTKVVTPQCIHLLLPKKMVLPMLMLHPEAKTKQDRPEDQHAAPPPMSSYPHILTGLLLDRHTVSVFFSIQHLSLIAMYAQLWRCGFEMLTSETTIQGYSND